MHCPHCENEIAVPSEAWELSAPWHCSFCGGTFGLRGDRQSAFAIPGDLRPLRPLLSDIIAQRFTFYCGPNYYVYALCYPTGIPFYVGMGNSRRCFQHVGETRRQASKGVGWSEKHDVIALMADTNESVWYHFLAMVPEREKAAEIEAYWIRKWGRRKHGGMLTNSATPESTLEDYQGLPPDVSEDGPEEVIKSFMHPDFMVIPVYASSRAPRSGAITRCPTCLKMGQYTAKMRHEKVMCANCGHFMIPWTKQIDDGSERVFFGLEVLHVEF